MAVSEFDVIQRYFQPSRPTRADVHLGIGDDCALLSVPAGQQLAVSIDTLVENVHFLAGCDPEALGHKSLAVNLSDLAAMGAEPAWATLALTLPRVDEMWLSAFAKGFFSLAGRYGVALVGGDTTQGPLSITVQVHGFVAPDRALRRDGAKFGDLIAVTGSLGDAGLALLTDYHRHDESEYLKARLERPTPRVDAGLALAGVASAAIDISDGLLADLGHICERSGVGAEIATNQLPLSPAVKEYIKNRADWSLPLTAGDDYELCFTVPAERQLLAENQLRGRGCELTWIGVIDQAPGVRCRNEKGNKLTLGTAGYAHFR